MSLFIRYNFILFLRVHGYTLPLVLLLYSSITLFLKAPTEEVKIWILITFLDFFVTASLLTYGGNLLGSERNFWIVRILSKSPTITSIYERLTALIFLKVLVGPFYTFLYCVVKKIEFPTSFYFSIFILNFGVFLWVSVLNSIINPVRCKSYFFGTDFQSTTVANVLHTIVMILVLVIFYTGQVFMRYEYRERIEVWVIGSVVVSIILFASFWTFGIRIFERMMYKNRFMIMQKLRQTA